MEIDLKTDIRVRSGEYFRLKYDKRTSYIKITHEAHDISSVYPYIIRLDELPDKASGFTVGGFTEVNYSPTSQGTFYVDYYMGDVYFYAGDAGKTVFCTYYGKGSIIQAYDINILNDFLERHRTRLEAMYVQATSPASREVIVNPGVFTVDGKKIAEVASYTSVDLGPGGNFECPATTPNYYRRILIACQAIGPLKPLMYLSQIKVSYGDPVPTPSFDWDNSNPSAFSSSSPLALLTVQDDGTGTVGTLLAIDQAHILDVRPLFDIKIT